MLHGKIWSPFLGRIPDESAVHDGLRCDYRSCRVQIPVEARCLTSFDSSLTKIGSPFALARPFELML